MKAKYLLFVGIVGLICALLLIYSTCSKPTKPTTEQRVARTLETVEPTVVKSEPTPETGFQSHKNPVKPKPRTLTPTVAARPKRASTLKAEVTPTPKPKGLLERKYAGELVGVQNYRIPAGILITLDPTPSKFPPYRCVFKEGIPVNIPCEIDWPQPDGTVIRGWFGHCLKPVVNQGRANEPDPRILPRYLAKDSSCAAQRAHDLTK